MMLDSKLGEYDSVQYLVVQFGEPLGESCIVMVPVAGDEFGNVIEEHGYHRCLTIPIRPE